MKSTLKRKKIYRLKNVSIDDIVNKYLQLQHTGKFQAPDLEFMPMVGVNVPQPKIFIHKDNTRKSISLLHDKFTYLIHLIRNRQIVNGGDFAPFHSAVLESIFGKDYNRMLKTLMKMDLLQCDSFYSVGSKCLGYRFANDTEFTYTLEPTVYLAKYSSKAQTLLDKSSESEKEAKEILDNNLLYDRYNQSLKLLKLAYPKECEVYLSKRKFLTSLSKDYHYYIYDTYQNSTLSITSVDKNKRIYSIATSTPRVIKPFLNIKFSCDIHNSHPLLFNSILFDYYNISLSIRKSLSSLFNIISLPSHNVRRNIRKELIHSGIKSEQIANIPNDVLAYLYITSIGKFWDLIIPYENEDKTLLRTDIKILMFAEVFYSKKLTTRGQKYAKIFKAQFPNVYKVVRQQKESDRTKLANDMMRLESQLFHQILMKLYNKRYKVVSIHDAIVVLDVKSNESCSVEVVKDIIEYVYSAYGLHPDVSVDYYGKEYVDKILTNEDKTNKLIESFNLELMELCESGDEKALNLKDQLENCKIELLPNNDYTAVVLHPVNPKYF